MGSKTKEVVHVSRMRKQQMRNERKETGWFAAGIGLFMIIYGAISIAGDSSLRGYGVDDMKRYYVEVAWMWDAYLLVFVISLVLIALGAILAVPIMLQDRKSRAK